MPQPFHRLARLEPRTARWWRPLLVLILAAVLAVALFIAGAVGAGLLVDAVPQLGGDPELEDLSNPVTLVIMLGMLAVLVPAVVLATRWAGGRPGTAHSVMGRFRWGLLWRAACVVLPLYVVGNGVLALVVEGLPTFADGVGVWLAVDLLIMVALVPLQAAGEEYAFRVLPQQVLGTWLRSPLWGIVLPIPLFTIAHGYDVWGLAGVGIFAACMGVLVWKTGGAELAILVHAANNLTLFVTTLFYPAGEGDQGAVPAGPAMADMARTIVITAGLYLWFSRREGLALREPARGRGRLTGSAERIAHRVG